MPYSAEVSLQKAPSDSARRGSPLAGNWGACIEENLCLMIPIVIQEY